MGVTTVLVLAEVSVGIRYSFSAACWSVSNISAPNTMYGVTRNKSVVVWYCNQCTMGLSCSSPNKITAGWGTLFWSFAVTAAKNWA